MRSRLPYSAPLLLAALLPCQEDPKARVQAALQTLVEDEDLYGAHVGVLVVDLADGSEWARHEASKSFMTASNMKLVSSAVALMTLGPDFRFVTRIEAEAPVEGGVLKGDLFLVGNGDPTLGGRQEEHPMAVLERMADAVKKTGINEVEGRVVGIDDCHADEVMGRGWQWDYQSDDYAAQISGLCFAENIARIVLRPTTVGQIPTFRVVPDVGYILLRSQIRCGEAGTTKVSLRAERGRGTNTVQVTGTFPVDALEETVTVTVENPTRYAARALKVALRDKGVEVKGPAVDSDDIQLESGGERRVIAEHESAPLKEILVTLNKVSQNLYAEQLLRASAAAALDEPPGTALAQRHAIEVLKALGVDTRGMVVADGSGLSRRNLVQPHQLAALLAVMYYGEHRDLYLSTLPVAGVDGTLKSRFPEGAPARGRVKAKTGFIGHVVALSGYVPRPQEDGQPLVFSILVNNFTCPTDEAKAAVDAFVNTLAVAAGWQD